MNSKDLQGLALIPDYFKYQVDAVKIEGRMKSALYVANAVQQYREAIDTFAMSPDAFNDRINEWTGHLGQVSNRGFTPASLVNPASTSSISYEWNGYSQSIQLMGIVKHRSNSQSLIEVKNPIQSGSTLQILSPHQPPTRIESIQCVSLSGKIKPSLNPNECGWVNHSIPENSILIQESHS